MFSAKDIFLTKAKGGYTIAKSLRFRSSASAYLSRTPGSAGNRKTWTWSAWVKRGALGAAQTIIKAGSSSYVYVYFDSNDTLYYQINTGSVTGLKNTTAVYRDPSAWYHIVVQCDTTQAAALNRMRLYVNGVEVTAWSTNTVSFAQNYDTDINSTVAHYLMTNSAANQYCDGYLSEVNFIDGQALDPTYFGQTDTATGVWMPKAYSGTGYGTNGFYLKFTDVGATSGSNAGYGKDFAGTNYWTTNNLSSTAGVTYDSMVDTPTNYDNGGNGAGNYATLNPVFPSGGTYSNANLKFVGPTAWANARSTIELPSSGKWYFEATVVANGQNNTLGSSYSYVGVTATSTTPSALGYNGANFVTLTDTGWLNNNATTSNAVGAALAANNLIGIAIDVDNNTFTFYRTNSSVASGTIGMPAGTPLVFVNGSYSAAYGNFDVNFGQRPFANTPPTGFKALCTQNLPTPTIGATSSTLANKYFDISLYTGNATYPRSITGLNFQPDFVWIKARSIGYSNVLYDVLRGTGNTKNLSSDTTSAEPAFSTLANLTSFNSNGFTVDTTSSTNILNANGVTFVGWQWKANGSGSSNTSGSITSTVSANVTAGFSVVTFTAPATNTFTVGHGLGVAPKMIIAKGRNQAYNWVVYHSAIGAGNYLMLNSANAAAANALSWANTAPTSTVFSTSGNGTYYYSGDTLVAYCFAEVAGYSKFGSLTGNASADGSFVYLGFKPKLILIKCSSTTGNWYMFDTVRNTYNVLGEQLYPNLSNAGSTVTTLDALSNGFKLRLTGDPNAAQTYIFAAWADVPFNFARAM